MAVKVAKKEEKMPFVFLVSVVVVCVTWAGIASLFSENELKNRETELEIQKERTKQLQMDYELAMSNRK